MTSRKLQRSDELQTHMQAILTAARSAPGDQRREIARDLTDLISEVLSYPEHQKRPSKLVNGPHAGVAADTAPILNRKAAMLRSYLEGSTMAAVARAHGVSDQTVRNNLIDTIRTLRKRARTAATFMGKVDLLEGMATYPTELTDDERSAYLNALAKFDEELERRRQSVSWADVWS